MVKIGAVINSKSGTLTPEESKNRIDSVKGSLWKYTEPELVSIVSGARVGEEMERLKDLGIDVLIVGGGDGTVSTAARIVGGSEIRLALIAMGTRNHFATDLGIPADPLEALRLLDHMHEKQIDTGGVNGVRFINNTTLGLYPELVRERERISRIHGWRKWFAHMAAGLIVLWRFPQMKFTIVDNNQRVKRLTPFLFVGNNEYREVLKPGSFRPSLTDGKLWVCIMRSSGILPLFRISWQLSMKNIQWAEDLETQLTPRLTVYSDRKKISAAIDGERHELSTPLQFQTHLKSLRVIIP